MKCPKCKIDLKRRRTARESKKVVRENTCPKCQKHYFSLELFQDDYDKIIEGYEKKIDSFSDQYLKLQDQHNELIGALKIVSKAVKKGKQKIGK